MEIKKIVLTGGPCAGKTTALSWIRDNIPKYGYKVLFVPETATELIGGGVTPWGCGTNIDYQRCQMELQMKKEELFERAGKTMDADFLQLCDEFGTTEEQFRNGYDAVFHLVTAANGAVEAYTNANNAARYESVEEAVALDDRLVAAWTGHPYLRIFDNSTGFEKKLEKLLTEILRFLGEPEPYSIEPSRS